MNQAGDDPGGGPARVDPAPPPARAAPWRDVRVLKWAYQFAVLGLVLALLAWLTNNVQVNSRRLRIPTGYEYLDRPAQMTIPGNAMRPTQPIREAILQGTLNTLRVVVVGIILATVLGLLVGIARLSGNWLVRNAARVYVEFFRNVPLLVILVFCYLAFVLTAMPRVEAAWQPLGLAVLSNRGAAVPWFSGPGRTMLAILALAALAGWGAAAFQRSLADRKGGLPQSGRWATLAFLAVVVLGFLTTQVGISVPEPGRVITGGIVMPPEFFALLVALVVYTASHIAEIVRGSIQAVPKGQGEAAFALALTGYQRMWRVILPQAMRIAVPPIGNQYLNLLKNSSLGFAISYFELTKVTSVSIGNAAPAVPSYLLLIAIYLVLSLLLSWMVNLVNRRLALVER